MKSILNNNNIMDNKNYKKPEIISEEIVDESFIGNDGDSIDITPDMNLGLESPFEMFEE